MSQKVLRLNLRIYRGHKRLRRYKSSYQVACVFTAMHNRDWQLVSSASNSIWSKSQTHFKWSERVWRLLRRWKDCLRNKWICHLEMTLPNYSIRLIRWWANGRPTLKSIRNHLVVSNTFLSTGSLKSRQPKESLIMSQSSWHMLKRKKTSSKPRGLN